MVKFLFFIPVTVEHFVDFMLASEKQPRLISIFILVGRSGIKQKLILHDLRFLLFFWGGIYCITPQATV